MSPYLLGLYEKSMPNEITLLEKLLATRNAGFDYLELSIDETDEKMGRLDWSEKEKKSLMHAIQETHTPIHSICLSAHRKYPLGHPDRSVQAKSLEIMEGAIVLASFLGVRIIQLAGYDVYYEDSNESSAEAFHRNLSTCVHMAAANGVILAFETMETSFMNTVQKAMVWVEQNKSPYLQIYPDLGNLTNAAEADPIKVQQDLLLGKGHIAALHLKETKPGIFRDCAFGEGHVDFPSGIHAVWDLGVRMFVSEFWYQGETNWAHALWQVNQFIRAHIDPISKREFRAV